MTDTPAPAADAVAADAAALDPAPAPLRYRLLTGPDDRRFCQRVSDALDAGYELYGSPSIAVGPDGPIVCQALIHP